MGGDRDYEQLPLQAAALPASPEGTPVVGCCPLWEKWARRARKGSRRVVAFVEGER